MEFIETLHGRGYKTLWKDGSKYYCVSSVQDNMLNISETMVFESDKNGNVINWSELYVCDYTEDHRSVMENFINGDYNV
jgi:hypothetical protein